MSQAILRSRRLSPVLLAFLAVTSSLFLLGPTARASTTQPWTGFADGFNYASISSMAVNGWTECGVGSNQFYNVSSGALTLQNGAAMCLNNIPPGVLNWTLAFRGQWAYNQYPTTGVQLVAQTAHHLYKFAAGEGNGLVVYRDNVIVLNTSGWYPYCNDYRYCYYSDLGVLHVYRLTMVGGVLTAYFDDNVDYKTVVGTYTEPDPGTGLVMVSLGSGSDIGVIWSSATVAPYDQTTTRVSCTPASVRVNQATFCTAAVADLFANEAVPSGTVSFTFSSTCTAGNPPVSYTCQVPFSSCTLANSSSTSSSCSVSYTSANCPCYDWQASPGIFTIGATYSGDLAHPSSAGAFSLKVTPLNETTVDLRCNPSVIVVNQVSSCTATVTDKYSSPTTPIGKVSFGGLQGCNLRSATASSASCSGNVTGGQNGSITVAASYEGDSFHYRNDGETGVWVNRRSTSTVVSCSPSTLGNGVATVCTATVSDTDSGTPITPGPWNTGEVVSVRFSSNLTGTFSASSCSLVATSKTGVASCSLSYTPSVYGHHVITGSFQTLDGWGIWDAGDYFHNGSAGTNQIISDPSDPSLAINSTAHFPGVTVNISGTLSIASGIVSGTVSITATNTTTGVSLFSKLYTITGVPASNGRARFLVNMGVSPYPLSANIILSQTGGLWSASIGVTKQIDIDGNGIVNMSDIATIAAAFKTGVGDPSYNPSADLFARDRIDIVDLATAAMYFDATSFS